MVGKAVSSISGAGNTGQLACREFIFCAQCAPFQHQHGHHKLLPALELNSAAQCN